ncbi:hypothetical protein RCOM_0851820 [Ricinus communis]|uniref:WAT1-related protein n=1 Tax=Ricinus communis TaxID=3988 RepID=B9RUC9_RICCO|nr:hypothetical protein RCOM_0851820 [Ricinus communis]
MAWRDYSRSNVVPFTAMVAVECSNVYTNTLIKAATLKGMSYYVLIVYTFAISTLVLLPLSVIFRSAAVLSLIKFPLMLTIFLLGLIGCLAQVFRCKGIEYSSPSLASAMSNLTPAFTFILAINFRFFFVYFCY